MTFIIDLSKKVVLLTGATSGIGLGIARQFARAGAILAGCGLETPEAAKNSETR